MVKVRRIAFVAWLFCFFVLGMWVAKADLGGGPTRYLKKDGPDTMPYRIVLRHCTNQEDTMAHLEVVDYTPERIVYRCHTDY